MNSTLGRVLMVLLLWALPAPALAGRHLETTHFYIYCREIDYRNGTVKDEDLTRWGTWLEASYTKLVDDMGFKAPYHPIAEDRKIKILVHSFAESDDFKDRALNPGFAVIATGRIHLNRVNYVDHTRDEANQCTIAHEFFHLIQYAYDRKEDAWLMEATARWAPEQVFPAIDQARYCIDAETKFISYSMLPLSFDFVRREDEERRTKLRGDVGRPYGASTFFRFVVKQTNDPGFVKRVWNAAAETVGANSLEAVSKGLGGAKALDAKFREMYDRFAVGCLLNDRAPADCTLADVAKLRVGGRRITVRRTDLSEKWLEHCRAQVDPKNFATYVPSWSDAPDLEALSKGEVLARRVGLAGWVAGRGGMRGFTVANPPGVSATMGMEVAVTAGQDAMSVQALASVGGAIKVFKGTFAGGKHTVTIPALSTAGAKIVVLLVGYADSISAVNYPVGVTLREQAESVTIAPRPVTWQTRVNSVLVTAPAAFKFDLWGGKAPFSGFQYTLYWAHSDAGPWTAISPPMGAGQNHSSADISNRVNKLAAHQFVLEDNTVLKEDPAVPVKPRYYVVGQKPVKWDAQGAVISEGDEMRSNVIAPSRTARVWIQNMDFDQKESAQAVSFHMLQVGLVIEDQVMQFEGAHVTVQAGGMTYHFWTPRREGTETIGSLSTNESHVQVYAPPWWPDEVTLTVEADGYTASRVVRLPLPDTWVVSNRESIAHGEKEVIDQTLYYDKEKTRIPEMIQYVQDQLKFKRDNPSEQATVDAQNKASLASYRADLVILEECKRPMTLNSVKAKIALYKGDFGSAMDLTRKNVAIQKHREDLELALIAEQESIYRATLASGSLSERDKKSVQSSIDEYVDRRKRVASGHKQAMLDALVASADMAMNVANPSAYSEAIQAIMATPDWEKLEANFAGHAVDGLWRVVGDRNAAANLWKKLQTQRIAEMPAERRAEFAKDLETSRKQNETWWPVGVPGIGP